MLDNKLLGDINNCRKLEELVIFERYVNVYYSADPYYRIYRFVLESKREEISGKKDKNKVC